jgi:hypothetical protein
MPVFLYPDVGFEDEVAEYAVFQNRPVHGNWKGVGGGPGFPVQGLVALNG